MEYNLILELEKYKHQILLKLIQNEKIVKAVANNNRDFLDYPVDDPYALLYENLFPYKKVPGASEEEKTIITLSVGDIVPVSHKFVTNQISFYIFTHVENLMRTNYGVSRTGYIGAQIHEMFNKSNQFGIGQLEISRLRDLEVNDHYFGVYLEYKDYNFDKK